MKGSIYQITTFTEPIATREEKAELPLQLEKALDINVFWQVN
jgi:hypothetical protein